MNEVKPNTFAYIQQGLGEVGSLRYSGAVKPARPGIVSANRPRLGSFATLVDQILDDESALDGLAFAYAELAEPDRQALARAVVQDAGDPTQALLAFLAVEESPRLQQRLTGLINQHGRVDQRAFLEGTEALGAARLSQSLPGLAPESLCIAWNDSKIHSIQIESRTDPQTEPFPGTVAGPHAGAFPAGAFPGTGAQTFPGTVGVAEVVDTVAPLVWRYIRSGGELPSGVERFAGFFSVA